MATTTRKCPKCGRRFRVPNESRRVKCESCSPPRVRAGAKVEAPAGPRPRSFVGECERVVRSCLEAASRDSTVPGVLAIRLARQMDSDEMSGAGAGALANRIDELVAKAMLGVRPERDFVDELAEARARAAGA